MFDGKCLGLSESTLDIAFAIALFFIYSFRRFLKNLILQWEGVRGRIEAWRMMRSAEECNAASGPFFGVGRPQGLLECPGSYGFNSER